MTIPADRNLPTLLPALSRSPAGQWGAGVSGNPRGRPLGARGRFSEALVTDFSKEWRAHGASVIATVRAKDPVAFLQIATRLVPKEVLLQLERPTENFTDDDLRELIEAVRDVPQIRAALRLLVEKVGELGREGEALKAEAEALYDVVRFAGEPS